MSKAFINKIRVYQNQGFREKTRKLFINEIGTILLTDGYSIIKLFDTNYNRKNRNDLITSIETNDNKFLNNRIIELYNNFEKNNFNIPAEKHGEYEDSYNKRTYCFFGNNNLSFDCKFLNRIIRIISNDGNVSYFLSETEKNAVCIVGKNGIAFLLGCKGF